MSIKYKNNVLQEISKDMEEITKTSTDQTSLVL